MNLLSRYKTARAARADADGGVDAKDRRMTADLGLSPAEIEQGTFEYRQAVQEAADTARLEELRDEERRAEDIQVLIGKPFPFTVGLVAAWVVELAGAILVMKSLGVPAAHRVLPAIALTGALIGLTRVTSKAATARRPEVEAAPAESDDPSGEPGDAPVPRRAPFDWMRLGLPVLYLVLVVAIALIRILSSNAEEVPLAAALSEAVLMIAISVGPAWIAGWLETKRAPAVELARRLAMLRQRVKREERRIRHAEERLRSHGRRVLEWTQENARRRAVYSTEHELARTREAQEGADATSTTPTDGPSSTRK